MRQRRPDSVRFDPYYKLQWWDKTSLAWRDIQRRFNSVDEATEAMMPSCRWRIMRITESGRAPVNPLLHERNEG